MFKLKSQKKKLAGLDIGSSSVKSVELSSNAGKAMLVYLANESLPTGAIEDGQIIKSAAVSNAIVTVFSNQRSKAQEMAVAVNGYSAILKNIVLPPMSDAELAESIDWHAEEHIPFDLADVLLDYQAIGSRRDELQVLIATCKRDTVANLKASVEATGTQTSIVDFNELALANCYIYNYEPEEDCLVALVDIGASTLTLHIMRGRRTEFMRTATIGGNYFTESLQKELGLSREQAEAAKRSGTREIEIKGAQIGGVVAELSKMLSFKALIDTFSEQVALEIRKSLDFYRAISENEARVEKLILTGGSCRIEGLFQFLSREFEVAVELLDPFRRIECDESVFSRDQLYEVAPEMAVAVGLALRGIEKAATFTINLLNAEEKRALIAAKLAESRKSYRFRARNRMGDIVKGERVAASREALKQILNDEGLTQLSLSEQFQSLFFFTSRFSKEHVSSKRLAQFTRRFTLLFKVDVSLVASLELLANQEKNSYFAQVLRAVVTSLEEGDRLTDALTRYPKVFDQRYLSMIEAGETGGILDLVLARLQVLLEKQLEWQRRFKVALLYPLTTIALLLLAVLGFTSRMAGAGSNNSKGITFGAGAVIILLLLLASIVAIFFFYQSERGRSWVDAQLLRTPLVGSFLRKKQMAGFARLFGSLLGNGVPILHSFEVCAGEARNVVFKEAINGVRRGVERGENLAEAMERHDVFGKFDTTIVGVGERTGALDAVLGKLADFYEHELEMTYAELPIRIVPFLAGLYILIVGLLLYYR